MTLFKSGVILFCALAMLALTACGFSASPADGLQFRAPAGWRPSPGILGFMQFWRSPQSDREMVMLFKSPRLMQPKEVLSDPQFQTTMKDATIERRDSILICGNQPAQYVEARGTSSRGEQVHIEMMMTNAAGTSYMAMYVRPMASPSNREAEASLRELCPKR